MTPNFKILADKTDITDLLNGRLLSLSITDEIGLVSDTMMIELDNRDNALAIPPRGAEMEVFLGYDQLHTMGKFITDEVEIKSPPETMSITARASDSAMRDIGAFLSPRSSSWETKTIADIVKTIAGRYGLRASVAVDLQSIVVSHLDQTEESDCAFIQRLASDNGASVKIAGGALLFIEPLSGKFPDGTPLPVIDIAGTDITSYRMRIAERGKYSKVIAKYYDFAAAEEKEVFVGASAPIFTIRETFANAAVAQARAKRKLAECDTGTINLTLDIVGNPFLSAESKINITNTRPEIAGEWIIKSARHNLSSGGYKTTLEVTRKTL